MAAGVTRISDIIEPEMFAGYVRQETEEKSNLINSGVVVRDAALDLALAGGGLTFNEPSFRDLDNDADNVSSDDPAVDSTPNKIQSSNEIQIRKSRNNSWSDMDLAQALAGADPMGAILAAVGRYWRRRLQAIFVATVNGVIADNAAVASGTDTHTQDDLTLDISGASFVDGVTNFSADAFIDGLTLLGDSEEDLGVVFMHSVVYARAKKNNLIDFVQDSINGQAISIPTFLGRTVIRDDGMPATGSVYDTWIFGPGTFRLGLSDPAVPVEVFRSPAAGNGGGQDTLHNRLEICLHPVGHAFIASSPAKGGPSNAATTGNLAHAASWSRVWPERKQIKFARLVTREA